MVRGFADVLPPEDLTVIGNIGDDVIQHGLYVSPDMDILTYTLAEVVDERKGWGYAEETYVVLETLKTLGVDTWMLLGDQDLATHILRTELRGDGVRPTEIAARLAERLGVRQRVLVPCDEDVQTCVDTSEGMFNFQEFYLRKKCVPDVNDVSFAGGKEAKPTPEVLSALSVADLLVFAPSNPIASIGPILAVPGMREAIRRSKAVTVAVSPLVGGACLKGPTLKMMNAVGLTPDLSGIAEFYKELVDLLVVDEVDDRPAKDVPIATVTAATVMQTREDKQRLARKVIKEASRLVDEEGA